MALKAHTNKHSGDKPGFHHRNVVRRSGNQTVCSPWVFPPLVCEPAPSLFYSLIGVDQSTSDEAFSMIIQRQGGREGGRQGGREGGRDQSEVGGGLRERRGVQGSKPQAGLFVCVYVCACVCMCVCVCVCIEVGAWMDVSLFLFIYFLFIFLQISSWFCVCASICSVCHPPTYVCVCYAWVPVHLCVCMCDGCVFV